MNQIDNFALIQKLSGKNDDDAPCHCGRTSFCMWCAAIELIRSEYGDNGVIAVLQKVRDFKNGIKR